MLQPPYIPHALRPFQYKCTEFPECEEAHKEVLCSYPPDIWKDTINHIIQAEADALEDEDYCAHVNNCPCPIIPMYLQKRYFRCGSHGHICAHCPHSKPLLPCLPHL